MLTITRPLPTALRADFLQSNESFADRIIGNYRQMAESVTAEDLLHLVTQPPEIFLMDGGAGVFFNETHVRNEQRQKVEVINNIANRILYAVDGHLNYQDEVYITNVLHKLGIRDEKTFMNQVFALTEETKQTNRLLHEYINNYESLTELVNEYRTANSRQENRYEDTQLSEILFLHEDVYRRWRAGDVYASQQSFRYSTQSATEINKESYQIAQQGRLVQKLLLKELREEVRGEAVPLYYRHENIYEGDDVTNENVSEQAVIERLGAAVLLSLVDNVYQAAYEKIDHNQAHVYHVENAFYEAAGDTFERILNNTDYRQVLYENARTEQTVENVNNGEYTLIRQLLEQTNAPQTNLYNETLSEDIFSPAETSLLTPETEAEAAQVTVDERNSLEQKLYQTNQMNLRRQEQFIRNLNALAEGYEASEPKKTREQRRRESLLALEHPDEFNRIEQEAAEQGEARERIFAEAARSLYPPSTQAVFTLIREYLSAPEQFVDSNLIAVNNESLLYYDVMMPPEARQEERLPEETLFLREKLLKEHLLYGEAAAAEEGTRPQAQRIHPRTEGDTGGVSEEVRSMIRSRIREIGESIVTVEEGERLELRQQTVERILEQLPGEVVTEVPEVPEAIRFSHRVEEQTFDEDTIAEIRKQLQHQEKTTSQLKEEVKNIAETTERQINQVTSEVITTSGQHYVTEEVPAKIDARTISDITEKVYSRIERQLSSERRRRGR